MVTQQLDVACATLRSLDGTLRLEVPRGAVVVGRAAESDVRLDRDGVSRRHATIDYDGHSAVLSDAGSTNGTTVNWAPLVGSRTLAAGDLVGFGPVRLVFTYVDGSATRRPVPQQQTPSVPRLRTPVLAAGATTAVGLGGNTLVVVVTKEMSQLAWILVPVMTVLVAMAAALVQELTERRAVSSVGERVGPARRSRRELVERLLWIAVVVILVGAVAYPLTKDVKQRVAARENIELSSPWASGSADGTGDAGPTAEASPDVAADTPRERLSEQVTEIFDGVEVTVTSLMQSEDTVTAQIVVTNGRENAIELRFVAMDPHPSEGEVLTDPSQGDFAKELPAHDNRSGPVAFTGELPAGTELAALELSIQNADGSIVDQLTSGEALFELVITGIQD